METAIVLGTFDGLHKGHRAVIDLARGYRIVAVTFDIPPKAHFDSDLKLLMLPSDKTAGLKQLGVSEICSLKFGEVKNISPEEFFDSLFKRFSPSLVACGFNYRFGKGAKGDTELLKTLCREKKIEFKSAKSVGGKTPVSSSAIRALISDGKISAANEQIYGGFGFTATVHHGDARGKGLGFPTVNQVFPDELIVPKFGVYSSEIIIDGKSYKSITNLGVRPTYQTDFIGTETFIKDFSGDAYGKRATLKLKEFIRCEKKFSSREELEKTVKADIKAVLGTD